MCLAWTTLCKDLPGDELLLPLQAQIRNCLSAFLHVIDYNLTAMAFYQRSKFQEIALLHDFYYIGWVARPSLPSCHNMSQPIPRTWPCMKCAQHETATSASTLMMLLTDRSISCSHASAICTLTWKAECV